MQDVKKQSLRSREVGKILGEEDASPTGKHTSKQETSTRT